MESLGAYEILLPPIESARVSIKPDMISKADLEDLPSSPVCSP